MWRALAIASCLVSPAVAQEFFTLKGHGGPIMGIAVSPSGQVATASFDNSVGLWKGGEARWLEGHAAAVIAVAFYSDEVLISGGDDFTVRLWAQSAEGVELGRHTAKVTDIATCRAERNWIATASWDATIRLWEVGATPSDIDATTRALAGHRAGVNDIAFSPDCTTLYSASTDGTVRVWDTDAAAEKRLLVTHGFGVNELVLHATAGWLAYGAVDGGTRIVDLETGAPIADFTLGRRPILAMDFDAAGAQLAVGDGEGYIMIIDTEAMKIARDFRAAQKGPIWALAFSPDGQNIHAGGIEDIAYSWPVATLSEHEPMSAPTRSFLESPDTLPNGERQFKRKCSICHTLTEGSARKAGPSLFGIFGRRAGTVADYSYSETLNGSEIVWSAETIDALFDIGPDHYIPGTKMPMQRIVEQSDRDDLIAYLRDVTAKGED